MAVKTIQTNGTIAYQGKTASITLLIDTGATYSIIPNKLAQQLGIVSTGTVTLQTGGGNVTLPMAEVTITIQKQSEVTIVAITPDDTAPNILGMKYLNAAGFMIDPASGTLKTLDPVVMNKQKIALYAGIILMAIFIPLGLKMGIPYFKSINTDYIVTFFVLLSGSIYELFNPWINKFMDYAKEVEQASQSGTNPPSPSDYFGHGITFNKIFIIFQALNFALALGISWYILYGGAVKYIDWEANVVVDFMYAVGQSRIIKERIFGSS